MSRNQFDLLEDNTLLERLEKQKVNQLKKSTTFLFRSSSSLEEGSKTKKQRKRRAAFEVVYDVEYLWFIVLEFLPLKDLLTCSLVDKFTSGMVHSLNCYGEILKRDFFKKYDTKRLGNIVKNIDNSGIYSYLLQDFMGKPKFTNQKIEGIKHAITQVPDAKHKKMFGRIYMTIEEEVDTENSQSEFLKQHVRYFLIEKLRKKPIQNMRNKVRECAHNHCEIVEVNSQPFTFRLECLDCKAAVFTNFRPESVFKKETILRYSRNIYRSQTVADVEKYVLNTNIHLFEFDRPTLYY